MIEHSFFCRMFASISQWFGRQFGYSKCIAVFLSQNDRQATVENSILYRVIHWMRSICLTLFSILGVDRASTGSIFRNPLLWGGIAIVGAVVFPTMVVLLFVVAAFGTLFLDLCCNKQRKLKYFAINKYIYIFAAIYGVSIFTSVTIGGSLLGGLLMVCFMLFSLVVVNIVQTRKQMDFVLILFILMGVLVSLYGFYQFAFPEKFSGVWHDKEMFEDIGFRVYATLENPNVLGEYFLLVIPLAFAYFLTGKTLRTKFIFLASFFIMMLCLILTYSRGCYIGILVAGFLFLVLLDKRFIILGIFGILLLPMILPQTIINRFMSIGNMADSSTSYRMYIYLGTLAMLKDYWFCGIGPGTNAFNLVYPAYAYNGISAPHAHNLFLQTVCDTGFCGIIAFIAILYQYYKVAFASFIHEKNREYRIFNIAGISAITGFLVQSLFDYTFYNYRVVLMFWAVLGFGILFTKMEALKGESQQEVEG